MKVIWISLLLASLGLTKEGREAHFMEHILPQLEDLCISCHDPDDSKGDVKLFDFKEPGELQNMRAVWRSAAVQLRNRTMPPPDRKKQPSEDQRKQLANWIEDYLAETACDSGPQAEPITARRLNRLEYNNTVVDLFGVDLRFDESLPIEGGSGEGFDNNGESLFLQPMLMERYLEAARQIVDAAIWSPRLDRRVIAKEMLPPPTKPEETRPLAPGAPLTALLPVYVEDGYRLHLRGRFEPGGTLIIRVDGVPLRRLQPKKKTEHLHLDTRLGRGTHAISLEARGKAKMAIRQIQLVQFDPGKPAGDAAARQGRLVGIEAGETPKQPKDLARAQLKKMMRLGFRRPVEEAEVSRYLGLVQRGLDRGDPFEEAMKLGYQGLLVSGDFLFRIEAPPAGPGLQPLDDHALANRLSYFLWARPPDAALRELAEAGRLQDEKVLLREANRLIDDPRSLVMAKAFTGQWLGTKDVGGRVAPTANDVQKFYTPDIASDMRKEPVRFVHHLMRENRSILELIDADYSFLSGRLAKFYELTPPEKLPKDRLVRVELPTRRRGGVLGMGAVLALTSHHKKTSPVLRGAWVFDTLIGEPVPPPPADIPPLSKSTAKNRSERATLKLHREHASCQACHELIDPIGFGLQNFDWVGRWREKDSGGPIDNAGVFPDGTRFEGPEGLRRALLETHQDAFVRNLSRKLLGYALGRSLTDRDDCTIEHLRERLETNDFRMRSLLHGIILSPQFRRVDGSP